MITIAGLIILSFELAAICRIVNPKLDDPGDDWSLMVGRFTPEEMFKIRHHSSMGICALCIATMGRLFS